MRRATVSIPLLLTAACALTGCHAGNGEDSAMGGANESTGLAGSFDRFDIESVRPGTLSDNGLEVRAWIVQDDSARIASSLVTLGEEAPLAESSRATLERNGLRLWRVPAGHIEDLRDGFGGSSIAKQSWLGQVTEWSDLHERSLGAGTRGVSIEGEVRRFRSGSFVLLVRAWTMNTEDGPRIQFQMIPFYADADAGGVRRILSQDDRAGESFPSLLVETGFESGFAYVLTCERPEVDWRVVADRAAAPESFGGSLTMPQGGDVRGSVGPPGQFGPDIGGPWTIGEALLRGDSDVGARGVILLIPHIPTGLYPAEMLPDPGEDDEDLDSISEL